MCVVPWLYCKTHALRNALCYPRPKKGLVTMETQSVLVSSAKVPVSKRKSRGASIVRHAMLRRYRRGYLHPVTPSCRSLYDAPPNGKCVRHSMLQSPSTRDIRESKYIFVTPFFFSLNIGRRISEPRHIEVGLLMCAGLPGSGHAQPAGCGRQCYAPLQQRCESGSGTALAAAFWGAG